MKEKQKQTKTFIKYALKETKQKGRLMSIRVRVRAHTSVVQILLVCWSFEKVYCTV